MKSEQDLQGSLEVDGEEGHFQAKRPAQAQPWGTATLPLGLAGVDLWGEERSRPGAGEQVRTAFRSL